MKISRSQRACIDITLTNIAFVKHFNDGPGNEGPEVYLSSDWRPILMVDNLIYAAQTLLGDAIVVCCAILGMPQLA